MQVGRKDLFIKECKIMNKLRTISNEIKRTLEVIETDLDNFRMDLDRVMSNAERPLTIDEIQKQSNYSDVSGGLFAKVLRSDKEIIQSEKQVGKKIIKTFEKRLDK